MKTLKNKKVLSSVFAILVCLALITGATMAWFTAGGGSNPTDYVAGTLGYDLVLNDGISEYLDTDALYPYVDYEFTTPDWQPGDVIGSSKAAWIDNAIAGLETYIGGTSYYQWLVERWVRFDRTLHPTDPFTDGNVVNIDFNIATGNEDLLNLLYGVKSTGAYWSYLDDGSYPGNAILDPVTGYLQNDYFDYGTLKNTGNLSVAVRLATGTGLKVAYAPTVEKPNPTDLVKYPLGKADPDYIIDLAAYEAALVYGDETLFPVALDIPQTYHNAQAIGEGDVSIFVDDTTDDTYLVLAPGAYLDLSLTIDAYTYAGSSVTTGNPTGNPGDVGYKSIDNAYQGAIIIFDLADLGTQSAQTGAWIDVFGVNNNDLTFISTIDLWGSTNVLW